MMVAYPMLEADEMAKFWIDDMQGAVVIEVGGRKVLVTVDEANDDPRILLEPSDGTVLEGDGPGDYILLPDPEDPRDPDGER